MNLKFLSAIAIAVLCLGTFAVAADQQAAQQEMMKKWMEASTPGPNHKAMQNLVGTWDAMVKSYMDPTDPTKATESKGTSTYTSLMDGRYVHETVESTFNGMPFQGQGTYAYDNVTKQYQGTWIDNMGTGIMTMTGSSPDGGKTINWKGSASDPMTGKVQAYRSVMHMMSADEYHFEMYGPGPTGKEMKAMEITYTRKK